MNPSTSNTTTATANVLQSDNLQALQRVMDTTFDIFNKMEDKDRVTQKSLIEKVSEIIGLNVEVVKPLVNLAVKQYSGITVVRGRKGGIVKGIVVKKVVEDTRARCATCKQVLRAKRVATAATETETVHAATTETDEVKGSEETSKVEDELDEFLSKDTEELDDSRDTEDDEDESND